MPAFIFIFYFASLKGLSSLKFFLTSSDMEFLLFKAPPSGWGMFWDETITYIQSLYGVIAWVVMEVTVVSGQCTIKQNQDWSN